MKHLVTKIKKHAKHVTKHVHKHKHWYGLATFGSFAVVKMFALVLGALGIAQFGGTFAQTPLELNSTNITQHPFNCATDATICYLEQKGITSIAANTFINHTNLQQLYLNENNLTSIENGDFNGLSSLIYLSLTTNQITSIDNGDLNGLSSLTYLGLGCNQITSIENNAFNNLSSLVELGLSDNKITSIDNGDPNGLSALTMLSFGNNQITSIENNAFDSLSSITQLYIQSNPGLQSLPESITNLTTLNDGNGLELEGLALCESQMSTTLINFLDTKRAPGKTTWQSQQDTTNCPLSPVTPTATNITISGNTILGATLLGMYSYTGSGLEGTSSYKRYRDNVEISGATGASYIITSNDIGTTIKFEVTPKSRQGLIGTPTQSNGLSIAAAAAPVASNVSILYSALNVGSTLTGRYSYNLGRSLVGPAGFSSAANYFNKLAISNDNTLYTAYRNTSTNYIQIYKFDGSNWTEIVTPGKNNGQDNTLGISTDSTNFAYVAYQNMDDSRKMRVQKLADNGKGGYNWTDIGSSISAGMATDTYIAIDTNDIPYIAFQDGGNQDKLTVKKYDSNTDSWLTVGTPGFCTSLGRGQDKVLTLDSNNIPYIACKYQDSYLNVMKFDGSTWINAGDTNQVTTNQVQSVTLAIAPNNTPYVAYQDRSNNKATAMKLSGSTWTAIGNANGFSTADTEYLSIAIDSTNTPYITYRDRAIFKAITMKFDGSNWITVGDAAGFSAGDTEYTQMVIDSNDTPYVAYMDKANGNKTSTMKLGANPNDEGSSVYRRYRNGEMIPGATHLSYLLTQSDAGTRIKFEVTPINQSSLEGTPVQSSELTINGASEVEQSPETVNIPADTSSNSTIISEFTAKQYQNAIGAIQSVPSGTYVGTKRINTNDSAGKILVPFVLQSLTTSQSPDKIEMKAPAGLVVKKEDGSPFLGIINNPTKKATSFASTANLPEVLSVVDFGNDKNENVYFKDTNNNPLSVDLRIPVPGASKFQLVNIKYSHDGSTWTTHETATRTVTMINNQPYVIVPSTHATYFAIGTETGSLVINGDAATTTSTTVTFDINASGAQKMRFSNDGIGRSAWENYATSRTWTLPGGFGLKTGYVQFDINNDGFADVTTSDSITYQANPTPFTCVGGHCADITLKIINSGESYCEVGESLDLGATGYSATARDISSNFPTTTNMSGWFCNDLKGTGESRLLYIQTSDLFNISTNNLAHTISGSNVAIKNPAASVVQGVCTANPGVSLDSRTAIDIPTVILGKLGNAGEICKIQTNTLDLKVTIPAYQAIGQYSGTLYITLPNF